jgi:hypothetical protein
MSRPFYLSEFHQIDVPESFGVDRGDGGADLVSDGVLPSATIFEMNTGFGIQAYGGDGGGSLWHDRASTASTLPYRNDPRRGSGRPFHVLSAEPPVEGRRMARAMSGSVRPANVIDLPTGPLLTKKTPSAEAWKLACLVLAFLIWISTAGTLLFLYMDRYLLG